VSFAEFTLVSEKFCVFLWLERAFDGWDRVRIQQVFAFVGLGSDVLCRRDTVKLR
jgi:hypothetical protein